MEAGKKETIFGRNTVLEYIKRIKNPGDAVLYISESAHGRIIDIILNSAKEKRIKIIHCNKEILYDFEPSSKHQGVVLELAHAKKILSEIKDIDFFLKNVREKKGVIVLLDQLTDPHNLGSIIRSTEAFGGDGVVLTKYRSADITAAVAKTSSGATAHLPVHTVANAANFIESAKKEGFWIIGTSGSGNTGPGKLKELKPAVIVIGSEGSGMRRLTEEKCDYVIRIPLAGHISSLNASVAAGIVLYEALKD